MARELLDRFAHLLLILALFLSVLWAIPAAAQHERAAYTLNTTTAPSPLTGLWWNPDESGWGISLTQQGPIIFVAWYTYDSTGAPTWYVMSNCAITGNSCTGEIYAVSGGTPPTMAWNGNGKVVNQVGSGSLAFSDDNTAIFSFTLNGVSGVKNIIRQMFGSGTTPPATNYSALWWNPDESGWGVALSQQYGIIFATWYTYDATGRAIWYVASKCDVSANGNGCSGELYQVTGGTPPTLAWNGANKVVSQVGNASFTFTGSGASTSGTLDFSLNGIPSSKTVTQEVFYTFPSTTTSTRASSTTTTSITTTTTQLNPFAGNWSGTATDTTGLSDCTLASWTASVSSYGVVTGQVTGANGECTGWTDAINGTVSSNGSAIFTIPTEGCTWQGTFSLTPSRSASGTISCGYTAQDGIWQGQ